MFEAAQGFVEDVLFAAAFVAGDFAAFDADERRGVADLAQALRDFSVMNWPLVKTWK